MSVLKASWACLGAMPTAEKLIQLTRVNDWSISFLALVIVDSNWQKNHLKGRTWLDREKKATKRATKKTAAKRSGSARRKPARKARAMRKSPARRKAA
jgi:hypothetical protein